jgi:hypothetical protein
MVRVQTGSPFFVDGSLAVIHNSGSRSVGVSTPKTKALYLVEALKRQDLKEMIALRNGGLHVPKRAGVSEISPRRKTWPTPIRRLEKGKSYEKFQTRV